MIICRSQKSILGEYEEPDRCPECGSKKIVRDYERAEIYCSECSTVLRDSFIDTGADWRAFGMKQEKEKARAGPPIDVKLHDKGLQTMISTRNEDGQENPLSPSEKTKFNRLRKWHRQTKYYDSKERNLSIALGELNRIASQLNIPRSIQEEASRKYKKAYDKDIIKGRSIEAMVGATLYITCREKKVPRTLDELSEVARVGRKEIGRAYRFVASKLGIMLEPPKPKEYVPRFCSLLGLSRNVESKAEEIAKKAREKKLIAGKDPVGVASGAIYIASVKCGEKRSQKKVAEASGVTEVTIRNVYQEICEKIDTEIDV